MNTDSLGLFVTDISECKRSIRVFFFYCLLDGYIKLLVCLCLFICDCVCVLAYSWSRTPVAAWPSNCCCCRMLSKSSMRWSEFSMWAGRWQFRKQMVWPNTDMRALTPPLFPCYHREAEGKLNHIKEKKGCVVKRGRRLLLIISLEAKWNEWMKLLRSVMEKCLQTVIGMSVFSLYWAIRVPATEKQEIYSLRTSESFSHQYLMLTVKCTVGGQDESAGFFLLFPQLPWPTKTQKTFQYKIYRMCWCLSSYKHIAANIFFAYFKENWLLVSYSSV